MSLRVLAGVEMGGTKCNCILGTGPEDIRAQVVIPTRDPATTLPEIAGVLEGWSASHGPLAAVGVAAFGPVDLRRDSRTYGRIGATPKPGWEGVDLFGFFSKRFTVPVGLTTDVIGAALAEGRWGDARTLTDFAYVTVGTGVGVGLIGGGRPIIGCHHPELGHIRIARRPGDSWPGSCRFHGDCVEGLASGPAIEARAGTAAANLSSDSPVWETVAHALAQLSHTLVLAVAPQRILIGGGVISGQTHLFPRIRQLFTLSLNGYLQTVEITSGLDRYIVPPGLGTGAGPLGALAVAADCASS